MKEQQLLFQLIYHFGQYFMFHVFQSFHECFFEQNNLVKALKVVSNCNFFTILMKKCFVARFPILIFLDKNIRFAEDENFVYELCASAIINKCQSTLILPLFLSIPSLSPSPSLFLSLSLPNSPQQFHFSFKLHTHPLMHAHTHIHEHTNENSNTHTHHMPPHTQTHTHLSSLSKYFFMLKYQPRISFVNNSCETYIFFSCIR